MASSGNWIFNYSLSEKIQYDTLKGDSDVTFKTEDYYIVGFQIVVRGLDQSKAEEDSRFKANIVQRLITVRSGMAVRCHQTSCEQIGIHYPRVIQKNSIEKYKIEGKIGMLDLNDHGIQKLFNSPPSKNLKFLSDAVKLKYYGFNEYSIRESYKILEHTGTTEPKFTVLRHAFSHEKLKKTGPKDWFDDFNSHYGRSYFDYEFYNIVAKDFFINFESSRTQQELGKLAKELIDKCKTLLGL